MSITPLPPAENSQGGFKTWVSSQRKFLALTGQFSVALNRPARRGISQTQNPHIRPARIVKPTQNLPTKIREEPDLLIEHDWLAAKTAQTGGRPRTSYAINPGALV
jgi:hypothetical protein